MASEIAYIGGAVPHRAVWATNTTLFHLASHYLGDATLWYVIARLNDLTDPWIGELRRIILPNQVPPSNGGLLGL